MKGYIFKPGTPQRVLIALLLIIAILPVTQSIRSIAQASPPGTSVQTTIVSHVPAAPTGLTRMSPDNNPLPAFKWSVVVGAASYEVQMDGGVWTDIGNKISYVQPTILTKASHTFAVRAKDGSGTSSPTSLVFGVSATIDLANSKIAFESNRDDGVAYGQIFTMNSDGSGPVKLTAPESTFGKPVWSPSGSKIAYGNIGTSMYISVMNPDGSGKVNVAGPALKDSRVSWSPDSLKLAYVDHTNFQIFSVNADGSGNTQLTSPPGALKDYDPAWSPDGTKIAFNRSGSIYTMDANGSNLTLIATGTQPSWSPDGSRIAFNGGIWVINPDGSGQLIAASLGNYPTWSPDGSKIVFFSSYGTSGEIYKINADGTSLVQLTNNAAEDIDSSWSPDGTKIVFSSRRDGDWEVFVMDANGSNQTNLINNLKDDRTPAWSPFLNLVPWSMQWGGHNTPASLAANQPASVTVTVTNRSTMTWPSGGGNPVYLSYHWYNSLGQVSVWDGLRTTLPNDLYSFQSATLTANLKAPSTPGNYTLKWDLVQEGINWFSFSGAATYDVPVTITTPVYNVQWGSHNTPANMAGKETVNVSVSVTNVGTLTWPSGGANPVYLSYHWYSEGSVYVWDGLRTPLPGNVAPGESVTLTASLKAPAGPSTPVVKWDMVQEGATWFSFNGAPTLDVPVTVAKQVYDVQWGSESTPGSMTANEQVNLSFYIKNAGTMTWPSGGANPVKLSYHWYNASGQVVLWDGLRTALPSNMAELDFTTLTASLKAPPGGGNYTLKWDPVHEGVKWFSFAEVPVLSKAVTVNPASYSVQWGSHNTPTTLNASQSVNVSVAITNAGSTTWPSGGATPVKLSYHWLNSLGQVVTWDGQRTSLTADLVTGQSATLTAALTAPSSPGTYTLQWDIVREGITWFASTGAPVLTVSGITVN